MSPPPLLGGEVDDGLGSEVACTTLEVRVEILGMGAGTNVGGREVGRAKVDVEVTVVGAFALPSEIVVMTIEVTAVVVGPARVVVKGCTGGGGGGAAWEVAGGC